MNRVASLVMRSTSVWISCAALGYGIAVASATNAAILEQMSGSPPLPAIAGRPLLVWAPLSVLLMLEIGGITWLLREQPRRGFWMAAACSAGVLTVTWVAFCYLPARQLLLG